MNKIVSIILSIVLVLGSIACVFAGSTDTTTWNSKAAYPTDIVNTKYFTAVKYLSDKKVISGYEDGLFHAEKNISRAEMAKMLVLISNNSGRIGEFQNLNTFNDLDKHQWAKGYINTAAGIGAIKGVGNSKFNPSGQITYAEAITMIIRLRDEIKDSDLPGTWPKNYIDYAGRYSMVSNITIEDWNAPINRGDAALILYRNMK